MKQPLTGIEHVLLDTDIGSDVDDALALLFGLRCPHLSLDGVTTVYGKSDLRAKIARKITHLANRSDIPVAVGEAIPLRTIYDGTWETGWEGVGILSEEEKEASLAALGIRNDAVGFLVETVMRSPQKYTIVAIGALTNVAKAISYEPKIVEAVKQMYIMGGSICYPFSFNLESGDRSTEPEHNIACDVEAAQRVFRSGIPVTLFPLDVTSHAGIAREDFDKLDWVDDAGAAVKSLVDVWFYYRNMVYGGKVYSTCAHDPLTLAGVVYPELTSKLSLPLRINDNGVMEVGGNILVQVTYDLNYDLFKEIFLTTIGKMPG